jgi:hypothetical protein
MKPTQFSPQSFRRFLCVTAVVAGLAVGGALTSCGSSRSSLSAGHTPAVLHLGAGGGRQSTAAGAADSKMMPMRPTSYVFDGTAPDLGASAKAYTLGGQAPTAAVVEQYAKAFGLSAAARELPSDQGGGWAVGAADYTAPVLTAGQWGMHQWSYSTPASATAGVSCAEPSPPDGVAVTAPPADKCAQPAPVTNLPTEAEAIAAAQRILGAMGLDSAAYTFSTFPSSWNVTVNGVLTVDGMATDLNVSFTFGANSEVQYAGGSLGTLTPLDTYPIVSVADGVTRLGDPTGPWWAFGGPMVMARGGVSVAVDTAAGGTSAAPIPVPSGTIPVDVPVGTVLIGDAPDLPAPVDTAPAGTVTIDTTPFVVHLSGVKLVLSSVWQADGSQILLPAFAFTSSDGGEYRVLAVDATYLDTAPATTSSSVPPATAIGVSTGTGSSGSGTPGLGTIALATFDDAKQLAGLPLEKAKAVADSKGWVLRVAEQDGVSNPLTDDLMPNRVNVVVKAGVVFDIASVG